MIRTRLVEAARFASEPLIVCLLGLPASWPLLKSTLPRSFDGLFHLYRLLELDHLLRQGVLFSRWAPDLYYGYGYPIFNFVPPLPYYLAEVLHATGLSLVHTILASFLVTLLASGVTMYFFVRDIFGSEAGLLSAIAYMYAPFHLYDILFRGHLPGAVAMVLYPLILWSFRRLVNKGGLPYVVASTLSYAACLLTHNPATLIFTPFLALYLTVLVCTRKAGIRAAGFRVAVAFLLGVGLASFFWIGALWDRQWIQLDRMITPPDLDFHNHFVSIKELLAPSPSADTGLMNPGLPNNIGPAFIVLSLAGVAALWVLHGREEKVHVILFALLVGGTLFMLLRESAFVWEHVPLLKYLAYPHRFLRLASLGVAVLCGAAVRLFPAQRRVLSSSFLVTAVSIGMIVISTLSLLYPPYYRDLPLNPSFIDMMEFERRTHTLGTTSFGEYLPVWAEWTGTGSSLEAMYRTGATIERFERNALPDGTDGTEARYAPHSMAIRLSAPQDFQATISSLYYPGWRAFVDGHETAISPTPGLGLISFAVPAGEHLIELRFEDMPIHTLAKFSAGLSAVLAVLLAAALALRPSRAHRVLPLFDAATTSRHGAELSHVIHSRHVSILATIAVILLAVKVGYIDRHSTWFKIDFDGQRVAEAENALQVNFADQVTLLGYNISDPHPRAADTVILDLYWKARQRLASDYSAFAHIVDSDMNIYAQEDSLNPGRYPTRYWGLDEYNKDTHEIVIPPGTPPGQYILGVGLYDPLTMMRLPISEEGQRSGMLILQEITVQKSDSPPSIDALGIEKPMHVEFDNGMTFLGYTLEREHLLPGDFFRVALFWEAAHELDANYTVALRLSDNGGQAVLRHRSDPSAGRYPTCVWEEGEVVRDNHGLWIRKDFPPGEYVLQLALFDPQEEMVPVKVPTDDKLTQGWVELTSVRTED